MKKYLLLLFCFAAHIVKAQTTTLNLWPPNRLIDTANGKTLIEHDITKSTDGKIGGKAVIRLADITNATIEIYAPKNPDGTAVIVCPGGGYSILAMDLEGSEICAWLNSIGVTGILLKYRVPAPPGKLRYELPLQDAQRAMGIVRYNAVKWHINPTHIGIMGFSAGGHLTAALSNNYMARIYLQVDAADTVSCRPDFAILIYPGYLKDNQNAARLAPEVQVSPNTPPSFLVQTEDDPVDVQNSLTYYSELMKFKVPAEMHLFPQGGHGYGMRMTTGGLVSYPKLLQLWLKNSGF